MNRETFQFELTDTFSGEANYSWVNRTEVTVPAATTDLALVRRAKAWAGLSGMRCDIANYGDSIEVRPRGKNAPCVILFISWVQQ